MSTRLSASFWKSFCFWCSSYYIRRYATKFAHARKLLIFDIGLIITACILLYLGLSWVLFSPEISALHITFKAQPERIVSGEQLAFDITVQNVSHNPIPNFAAYIALPNGFRPTAIAVDDKSYPTSSLGYLVYNKELPPKEQAVIHITGKFIASLEAESPLSVTIQFTQDGVQESQTAFGRFFVIPRESVLALSPQEDEAGTFIAGTSSTLDLVLRNQGIDNIRSTTIHIDPPPGIHIDLNDSGSLSPGKERVVRLQFRIPHDYPDDTLILTAIPVIILDNASFLQKPLVLSREIIRPRVAFSSTWRSSDAAVGETATIDISVRNDSTRPIDQPRLMLAAKDATSLGVSPRDATIQAGAYAIPLGDSLPAGESHHISLTLDITTADVLNRMIALPLSLSGTIAQQKIDVPYTSDALPIASTIHLERDVRFYTTEGDQIGRGALPFRVGKETTVWAIFVVRNTTSDIADLSLRATLPEGIVWTGNASLTHGTQPHRSSNNTISWHANNLGAFSTAIINLELSITPQAGQLGTSPAMLRDIQFSATDRHTGRVLQKDPFSLLLTHSRDVRLLSAGTGITQ